MSLGLIVGSIANDAKSVSLLQHIILLPFTIYRGFFKNIDTLSIWNGWIQYLSPIRSMKFNLLKSRY